MCMTVYGFYGVIKLPKKNLGHTNDTLKKKILQNKFCVTHTCSRKTRLTVCVHDAATPRFFFFFFFKRVSLLFSLTPDRSSSEMSKDFLRPKVIRMKPSDFNSMETRTARRSHGISQDALFAGRAVRRCAAPLVPAIRASPCDISSSWAIPQKPNTSENIVLEHPWKKTRGVQFSRRDRRNSSGCAAADENDGKLSGNTCVRCPSKANARGR